MGHHQPRRRRSTVSAQPVLSRAALERRLQEIEEQLARLTRVQQDEGVDLRSQIAEMTARANEIRAKIRPPEHYYNIMMWWVAARCTLQYVILPFGLPVVVMGVSGSVALWLSIVISILALGMILFNLRRLWGTSWRWRYLALSLVASSVIVLFLYFDLMVLSAMLSHDG
jgi:hypothetical protein